MTIIFDWDGTLHDTKKIYGKAFRKAYNNLIKLGYAPENFFTDDEVSIYLGMNSIDMWNTFMPDLPQKLKDISSNTINKEMIKLIENGEAKLYEGALEILKTLSKNNTLIFLSNCKHNYMEAHKKRFNLDNYFTDFYCCQDYNFIPKTEIFRFIKEKYPEPYLIIGDRDSDLEIAEIYDLLSIGCNYGYGENKELKTATYTANKPIDIIPILNNINESLETN